MVSRFDRVRLSMINRAMARTSILILVLVVMSHEAVCENRADSGKYLQANQDNQLPHEVISVDLGHQELKTFSPTLRELAHIKAMQLANRNDDHSNIELDKMILMNDANRYDTYPGAIITMGATRRVRGNDANFGRPFSKMINQRQSGNEFLRTQSDWKRNFQQLANTKEDKDYTFVGAPMNKHYFGQLQRYGKWLTPNLRDVLLSKGQAFTFANDDNNYLNNNQLSQVDDSSVSGIMENANDELPTNREKRRRCKMDPNLGVKNPSFCDTDAYFGAADYSMRDVWDSAGRRR